MTQATAAQRLLALLMLVLTPLHLAWAETEAEGDRVYRTVDAQGRVIFSDQPINAQSTPVELPDAHFYDSVDIPLSPRTPPLAEEAEAPPYQTLMILSPSPDEAIRSNSGDLSVRARISPSLLPGHRLQLLLDGRAVSAPGTLTRFELENVDRGTHTAVLQVVDGEGQVVMRSEPVQFHVLRAAVGGAP